MTPLVSVVMAVRNGSAYIAEAIESVLAQTLDDQELVVVDGGSTDGTQEIAGSFSGVRLVDQAGTGFAPAWNQGLDAARGELLGILDADDLWEPTKLERQVELLESDPAVDYAITRMRFQLEPGMPIPSGFRPELLERDHVGNLPSAILIRRGALDRVGMFRSDLTIASDIEWFARLKDMGLTRAVVPEVLVIKRVHDTNLAYTAAGDLNRQLLVLLRESIHRRR